MFIFTILWYVVQNTFYQKKRRWLNLDMSGKIEVKSPSVRRLSKLYLPLTHAIPLEIRHAGKQAILTQSR